MVHRLRSVEEVNITKAITDHAPDATRELVKEKQRLIVRITAINLELALWQTLNEIIEVHNRPEGA
jgi:hypothetical protein